MTLRLHGSPDSANLVVRVALEAFGMAFEDVAVDRARGGHRLPAYLALNPQGLIPALEDGDRVLFETGAILLHLVERAGRWGPEGPEAFDPLARARALPWLFFLSNTLHADLRVAFYARRYLPDPGEAAALSRGAAERIAGHLALVEAEIAARGGLAGETPTVCEQYLGVCCRWAQLYPRNPAPVLDRALPPHLRALLEELEQRPEVRRAMAAEHIPGERPYTVPEPPDLPPEAVTG